MKLESYVAGHWHAGNGPAVALRDASTGDVIAEASSEGVDFEEVLTYSALDFLAGLHRSFNPTRLTLLGHRAARQKRINDGALLEFLDPTSEARCAMTSGTS